MQQDPAAAEALYRPYSRLPEWRRGDGRVRRGRTAARVWCARDARSSGCAQPDRNVSRPETTLTIRGRQASKRVTLATYLDADAREQCEIESNRWIKALRLAVVDEDALRDRFLYRGDSLWWFAELYLHKRGRIARLHRCLGVSNDSWQRSNPSRSSSRSRATCRWMPLGRCWPNTESPSLPAPGPRCRSGTIMCARRRSRSSTAPRHTCRRSDPIGTAATPGRPMSHASSMPRSGATTPAPDEPIVRPTWVQCSTHWLPGYRVTG